MKITIENLHIGINLGSKLQLQQRILIYETNFKKKQYFQLKTEKINITLNSSYSDYSVPISSSN